MTTLIVGASLAGLRTAEELRNRGHTGAITMIGEEAHLPYDRPPLSKSFQAGDPPADTMLRSADELDALGIELVLGERAVALDPANRTLHTAGGREYGYDALVIATGSRARRPHWDVPGTFVLRTLDDARAIASQAASARSAVVVGGGFVACETASALVDTIPDVTLVTRGASVLTRALGHELGSRVARRLEGAGVRLRTHDEVETVVGESSVEAVRLRSGDTLPADLVVAGIGAVPNDEWLRRSGLVVGDGVHCDERCRAFGADDVYAVGDVALTYRPRYGRPLRIEHWTNAQESAAVAAAQIIGHDDPLDTVPYLWSEMLGAFLQVFGVVKPADDVIVVIDDHDGDRWLAITGSDDRLGAVVGWNAVREARPYRKLLANGASLSDSMAVTSQP